MRVKTTEELLVKHLEQLDEEKVLDLASQALDEGMDPLFLLELMNEGVKRVGKLYESKNYYIADLIMAGLIYKQVLELEKIVEYFHNPQKEKVGTILLGTVRGDIHDIGKNIFRGMSEAHGFQVIDLGVDVPAEQFLKNFFRYKPHIVGLSGVLTSSLEEMKRVVDVFHEAGLGEKVRIIVGANFLSEDLFSYIGADGFANEASEGIKICKAWMNE